MDIESGTETTNSSNHLQKQFKSQINENQTSPTNTKHFSWQDIQKHTFTGWCNAILAEKNITIKDLFDDLHDGTVLIEIYQLLSGNPPPKYNNNPKIPQQIIENLDIAMKLFQQDGLTTVNIGPMDIYDKNDKLILGFIWHLILYYQIGTALMITPNNDMASPVGKCSPVKGVNSQSPSHFSDQMSPSKAQNLKQENVDNAKELSPKSTNSEARQTLDKYSVEGSTTSTKSPPGGVIRRASLRAKPQKLILDWASSVLNEFTINNLTTDWNDGILLGALINRFNPKCCTNYKKWKKSNAIQNVTEAFKAAQIHLNIPTIIKPEHLASGEIDPQSLMTYISQFTKKGAIAFSSTFNRLKKLAPQISKLVASMDQQYWNDGVAFASLVEVCCLSPVQQSGGFHKKVNAYSGDKKTMETRSISNIASALMEAEKCLKLQPTFTPEDLLHQKVHPLVFITYVNHLLNSLEVKENVCKESLPDESVLELDSKSPHKHSQKITPLNKAMCGNSGGTLRNSSLFISSSNTAASSRNECNPKADSTKITHLEMSWLSNTEYCSPGDELRFEIRNFEQLHANFDDVHVEITYFRDDEEYKTNQTNQKSKSFIPFKLYHLDNDTIEGKFCAKLHGIYRVQASIKGKVIHPVLYKRTSSSDEPLSPLKYNKKFELNDFECVFRDTHVVVDKDFILTVYSSGNANPEKFDFFFRSSTNVESQAIVQLDHTDSLRYVYRTRFNSVGTYTLYAREKSSGKMFCYKNCTALVGDPTKITIISNNDKLVNPGEVIQIVCDVTDAGPGCLSAEVIYEGRFFGYASVSSENEAARIHAVVTYVVPVIFCGNFEFKLKWNDFYVDTTAKKSADNNISNTSLEFVSFDPSKAIVQGDGLKKTIPINCDQYFTVSANNVNCIKKIEGYLKLLEDISNKKTKIEFIPDNHNTYVVHYQLERVGTYQLDLFINGRPVFENPFLIESIDLNFVKVKIESEPRINNQQFIMKVSVYKKAGKGDLYYSLEGPNGPLKMSIEPLHNDDEKESFLLCSDTNCSGNYTVDLTYGGYSISGFPKVFTVSNFEINKNTVSVDSDGKLMCLMENTTAEFEFRLDGVDSERDYKLLSGNVVEMDDYENIKKLIPIDIKRSKINGTFVGCLPTLSHNTKFLNLFFNKIPFPGNPSPLEVFKQSSFSLKLKNDIDKIFVNDLVGVILKTPVQFHEKQLNCALKVNSSNENITIEKGRRIQTLSPCCEFEYSWSPTTATTYDVCAFFNEIPLTNTSIKLQVENKPLRDLAKDHNVMFKMDDDIVFLPTDKGKITPRIVMNERGNALYLSGYMLSNNGNVKLPLKFQQESSCDGVKLVHAWYYHALPGVYSVWINYDEKPLDETPFRVEVLETHLFSVAPDPEYKNKPLVYGGPKYYFYATIPSSILLQHCILTIESPKGKTHFLQIINDYEEISSHDENLRQLRVPFYEPSHGVHHVGLIYQTISIDQTFMNIDIQMHQLDVSQIRVEINRPENVLFNATHEIIIKTNGIRQPNFLTFEGSIHVNNDSGASCMQPVTFIRRDNATYLCHFYIKSLDATQLRLACEDIDLIGSPFDLNVIDLSRARVVFPLFENSKPIFCNDECLLNAYIPFDSGEGQLRIYYTNPNMELYEVPYENSKTRIEEYHSYCAKFKLEIPGHYNLKVTYGGFDVSNSPYGFDVLPVAPSSVIAPETLGEGKSPEFTIEFNTDKSYFVNEATSIPVYFMKKMNAAKLKNFIFKIIDSSDCETILNLYKDIDYSGYYDKYLIDFFPKKEGLHNVVVSNKITGDIHTYEIRAIRHYAVGLYCVNVPDMCSVGEKFCFDIIIDNRFPTKSVRCRCIGPNNKASFISITTNSREGYQVHVTPKCVGPHRLELEADQLPIRDSPYKVVVLEEDFEDSVKISGPGLNSCVLKDYIGEFEIDLVGEPGGELEIHLTGPDNSYKLHSQVVRREKFMMVSSSGKNKNIEIFTIKCDYNPLIPGIYIIEIFWKGVQIKKSPFKV